MPSTPKHVRDRLRRHERRADPRGFPRIALSLARTAASLRRAKRVLLDLEVELSDELSCRNHIADIDDPLDHASVEARAEAGLVLGADVTRQLNGLAFRAALDGEYPDGLGLRGGWYWLDAARDGRGDQSGTKSEA